MDQEADRFADKIRCIGVYECLFCYLHLNDVLRLLQPPKKAVQES